MCSEMLFYELILYKILSTKVNGGILTFFSHQITVTLVVTIFIVIHFVFFFPQTLTDIYIYIYIYSHSFCQYVFR